MINPRFLTAAEVARECNFPVSALLRAVADGRVVPAGRAGQSRNSAVLFLENDVAAVAAAVRGEAVGIVGRKHLCQNLAEVVAKGDAMRRAAAEAQE